MEIEEIHEYLSKYVKPFDDLIYRGFTDKEMTVKGKRFLEFYHGT
jgi:negative regulator of genetic competence, sporulation and motility